MSINPKLRVGLVLAALAATLAAVRWADSLPETQPAGTDALVAPTARSVRPAAPTAATAERASPLDLEKLQRQRAAEPAADLFGRRNFAPAPPKMKIAQLPGESAAVAPPPPPPQAPPLPFTYLGKLAEDQGTTVFLAHGDRNLVVKPGDVIDSTYRVEQVTDNAVLLTYLPFNQTQLLAIGTQ